MSTPVAGIRERLRVERTRAMKARDAVALAACRTALAALDNAEAVPADPAGHRAGPIETSAIGAGAADVARRELSDAEEVAIVAAEVGERHSAASRVEASHPQTAARLRAEAAVLALLLAAHGEASDRPACRPDEVPPPNGTHAGAQLLWPATELNSVSSIHRRDPAGRRAPVRRSPGGVRRLPLGRIGLSAVDEGSRAAKASRANAMTLAMQVCHDRPPLPPTLSGFDRSKCVVAVGAS